MRRKLPPLAALRTFESAARTMSFTRAAEELLVTQGAVSRQIRLLEDFLGTQLFVRLTRKIDLTPAGERYYASIGTLFEELEVATMQLRGETQQNIIRVSVLPTISSFWLMPRLATFSQGRHEAELRIISSIEPVDLQAMGADLAIRVGRVPGEEYGPDNPRIEMEMVTDWRGVHTDLLFPDVLVPICSREWLVVHGPLKSINDLAQHRLIHVTTRRYAWQDWLRAHGASLDPDRSASYFGHFFMAMEAARSGKGIAIVPTILLRHFEGFKDLVCPFKPDVRSAGNYHLLFHENRTRDPQISRFRQWLVEEAAAECRADNGFAG
jgi:LysR family transcriptional regulator, glycine cleavage system transcriptional activator